MQKNRIAKIIVGLVLFFGTVGIVYAQQDYTVLTPLPGTLKTGGKTDFATYLPGMFTLIIYVAGFMAFVMITFGGVMYMTTDVSGKKSQGKEYIQNAIVGLLLVIGAWVILYTINPKILDFTLGLETPSSTQPTPSTSGQCNNCMSLSGANIPTSGSAVGKSVSSSMIARLALLNENARNVGGWYVTEGYPPSVVHKSRCHNNGTCVDANVTTPTLSNIQSFFAASRKAGLSSSYEVTSREALTRLIGNNYRLIGTTATDAMGNIYVINTEATGPHFHIR